MQVKVGLIRIGCGVMALAAAIAGCEPMPCMGDSCNCYGDPEAPHANAGCADCRPEPTCEKLRDRVIACGIAFDGALSDCVSRVRATHSCIEIGDSLECDELRVACPAHDAACFAELVISHA
jgi:hypothetical protein